MAASLDDLLAELRAIRADASRRADPRPRPEGGARSPATGLTPTEAAKYEQILDRIQLKQSKNAELITQSNVLEEKKAKILQRQRELQVAIQSGDAASIENAKQAIINAENAVKEQDKLVESIRRAEEAAEDLADSFGSLFSGKAPDLKGMLDPKNIQGLAKNFKSLTDAKMLTQAASKAAVAALFEYSKAAVNLAIDLGDMETQFMKATGANQEFARSVTVAYKEARTFGASAEETSAAAQTLFNSFTDFTLVSGQARNNLIETSAVMARLGVSNQDFAKSIQTSTKAMGMSSDQAAQNMLNLEKFAENLGVAPQQLAADFAGAGDMLAKMGQQGTKAFKDLAIVAKTTGMQMESILAITNKFDTFEGAADQAGKLNAALGGNFVNAMDLMMATDPAERFGMIRDSILDAGLSFDEMSYYQKNFYKESLGLSDVGELAALMSGDMDLVAGATEDSAQSMIDAKKRAQEMATFQERLNMAFAQMIPIITPLIDLFSNFTKFVAENATEIKIFTGVFIALAGILTGGAALIPALVLGLSMLFDTIETKEEGVTGLGIIFDELSMTFGDLFDAIGRVFKPTMEFFGFLGENSKDGMGLKILVFALRGLAMALTAPIKAFIVVLNAVILLRDGLYALFSMVTGVGTGVESFNTSLHALGQSFINSIKPMLQFLDMFFDVNGAVESLGFTLFEKQYASSFLDGIGKIADAFAKVGLAVLDSLNPFSAVVKIVDSIGATFSSVLHSISSFFTAITDPTAAENVTRIAQAITAIPTKKNIEFASSMSALAASNAAAATVAAVTTTANTITEFVGGEDRNQNTTMAPAAATHYEVTINVMLDRDKLASVVQEINGNQAKQAIQGRR